jgi:hypothetical protein
LFFAHDWKGVLLAEVFRQLQPQNKVRLVYEKNLVSEEWPRRFITLGNGEVKETAFKVLGKELAQKVWEFSEKNYSEAENYFSRNQIPYSKVDIQWPETVESALCFDPRDIKFQGEISYVDKVTSISEANADCVVILSEIILSRFFPRFSTILIPVTLFSFLFPLLKNTSAKSSFFNGGIDFAFRLEKFLHIGSFRNLFEDKAVGVLDQIDTKSLEGITQFFARKKWIDSQNQKVQLRSFEAISCDGLGAVGSLSEAPHTFVVGGFAARTDNFIFAIAKNLAEGVLLGKKDSNLALFSTKRFV